MTFGRLRADRAKFESRDETRKRILDAVDEEGGDVLSTSGNARMEVLRERVEMDSNVGGVGMTASWEGGLRLTISLGTDYAKFTEHV